MTNTTIATSPDAELLADEARQHVLERMPNNVNHIVKEQAVHAAVRYAAQQLRKIWDGDWLFSELEQRVFELESAAQRLAWPSKDMSPEE